MRSMNAFSFPFQPPSASLATAGMEQGERAGRASGEGGLRPQQGTVRLVLRAVDIEGKPPDPRALQTLQGAGGGPARRLDQPAPAGELGVVWLFMAFVLSLATQAPRGGPSQLHCLGRPLLSLCRLQELPWQRAGGRAFQPVHLRRRAQRRRQVCRGEQAGCAWRLTGSMPAPPHFCGPSPRRCLQTSGGSSSTQLTCSGCVRYRMLPTMRMLFERAAPGTRLCPLSPCSSASAAYGQPLCVQGESIAFALGGNSKMMRAKNLGSLVNNSLGAGGTAQVGALPGGSFLHCCLCSGAACKMVHCAYAAVCGPALPISTCALPRLTPPTHPPKNRSLSTLRCCQPARAMHTSRRPVAPTRPVATSGVPARRIRWPPAAASRPTAASRSAATSRPAAPSGAIWA